MPDPMVRDVFGCTCTLWRRRNSIGCESHGAGFDHIDTVEGTARESDFWGDQNIDDTCHCDIRYRKVDTENSEDEEGKRDFSERIGLRPGMFVLLFGRRCASGQSARMVFQI